MFIMEIPTHGKAVFTLRRGPGVLETQFIEQR